ncbi:Isochorismatase [Furfurilactobacillus rossiae]|uniref:isochorismatase family protein n=1 Tax=Furfurilactobacillus rossiae TaxID=231049 RepID=UPI0015C0D1C1|nr:isochorismatase family protein [Furfurilactobacillus rossiae]MCF6164820.1 isochorismatase family protein [Furfurilactobacillus rossiae]QLE63834.1 Isochorismatase [Furfurilactobacillus rossiae]
MLQDALLVIDAQKGMVNAANYEQVIDQINDRIDAYRAENKPLLFIQHTDDEFVYGSDPWMLAPQLHRQQTDRVMLKYHSDSFYETGLASLLHHRAVRFVEICGFQTEYCVDTAMRVGHDQGFDMSIMQGLSSTMASHGLTAAQIINHHEQIWQGTFGHVLPNPTAESETTPENAVH